MQDNIKIFNDTREVSLNEYKNYTEDLTNNTVVYTEEYIKFFFANCNNLDKQQNISICNGDTISCVLNIYRKDNDNHIAMLNFADAYTPGGLVLKGATTQEECICRCSNLYESLISDKCKNDYYDYNARVEAETAIAEQNNALEIKKQELKKQSDIKKAEADAAYEIQEQEQRKTIEIATADANIAKQEKEAEIKEKEIAVKEKSLDAEVKKQADAEKYARMQKADADKYEAEQRAEAEKITKMKEAEAAKAQGVAEAEATKAKGMAEAETIRAKGMAEAEAMEKKADAMAKYGKAAMTEMIIKVLPQMAEAIAKPLESIDKVSIIGGAGDSGMSTISDNVPQVLAKTIESVKETTGFDLTEVMKANTYDARVNNNLNITTDLENKVVEKVVNEAVTDIEDNIPNTVAPDIDTAVHNEPVNTPKTHKNKKN